MGALLRYIIVLPLAYVAALIVASALMTFALFDGQITSDTFLLALGTMIGVTWYAGMTSFVPAVIAAALIEFFQLRSILYSLAAGGLVGAISWQTSASFDAFPEIDNLLALCLASGFVGGFVYWFCAGRDAGRSAVREV
jgi:hypothetical protein